MFLEMFQNKAICKTAVSKGWCKESRPFLNHAFEKLILVE